MWFGFISSHAMAGPTWLLVPAVVSIIGIALSFVEHYHGGLGYHAFLSNESWTKAHIVSRIVFCAAVGLGTLGELVAYPLGRYPEYMVWVPFVDNLLAVPSLAVCCLSGVAKVKIRYGAKVPTNMERTMKLLAAFGIFWALADRTSQAVEDSDSVFAFRASINVVSCALVLVIRALMFGNRKRVAEEAQATECALAQA